MNEVKRFNETTRSHLEKERRLKEKEEAEEINRRIRREKEERKLREFAEKKEEERRYYEEIEETKLRAKRESEFTAKKLQTHK